jgi:hypothetical protein
VATSAVFTANGTAGAYTVTASATGTSTPASFSLTNTAGAAASIAATSGTPQSATVGTAFALPLVATVLDSGSNPVSGVVVTFTAPATGASGTFAGGVNTATTNASGVATSAVFTANGNLGAYTVAATVAGVSTPANFSLTNTVGAGASIAATSGTPQSATVGTAFALPLVATVLDSGSNPVSGVVVTFTAPASGASGTFAGGVNTATTNARGVATSATFTANGTGGGPYTVAATVAGVSTPADFSLTNTGGNYSFYLSGMEAINGGPNFYALLGSVTIDANGNVLGGEQDYNDAFLLTSPEPSGDTITGGTLAVDSTTGQGTLTLITDNAALGVSGTETLGVQFVNTKHALIVQFDGSATSSGSMDLQTLPSTLSGGYALTLSGVDPGYYPIATGGVFSVSGTSLSNGIVDANDNGTVTTGTAFAATISAADSFGRGTITGVAFGGASVELNYYIVGPEVIRIIDVDTTDSAVGSAFGQGTNATAANNASLGSSVLAIANNPYSYEFGALGQFSTSNTSSNPADFSGVAEGNELDNGVLTPLASPISGTYSIPSTGYGSLTINNGGLGDVSVLGIYMTDPNLNLNDPNNTTGGGGALVLDLDVVLAGGTGVLIPQTDTTLADGKYAAGWQDFNYFTGCGDCEFDMVSQGSVTGGALSLTGLVSDPFFTWSAGATSVADTFSGTPLADGTNPGRYSMLSTNTTPNPLAVLINGVPGSFDLVLYQASGGQLFWLQYDTTNTSVFLGPLEQQGSLTGLSAARRAGAKSKPKRKQ